MKNVENKIIIFCTVALACLIIFQYFKVEKQSNQEMQCSEPFPSRAFVKN